MQRHHPVPGTGEQGIGEVRLLRAGMLFQALAFALLGACPRLGAWALVALFASAGLIAFGNFAMSQDDGKRVSFLVVNDFQGILQYFAIFVVL